MKKIVLILAVAGFAVACNNSSDKKTDTTDSTVKTVDSTVNINKDTVVHMMDTAKPAPADTTKK